MGFKEKLNEKIRNLGGKAKGKAGSGKDWLKEKWNKKLSRRKSESEESKVKTGEGGKYVENKGQMYVKTKKSDFIQCPKCGLQWNKTVYSECPDCKKKREEEEEERKKKEEEEEERKKKEEGEVKPKKEGKSGLLYILGIGGWTAVNIFLFMPVIVIITFVILTILAIIALIRLPWLKQPILFLFFAAIFIFFWTGQYAKITRDPRLIIYIEPIEETIENTKEEISKLWSSVNCYRRITPDEVDACLREIEKEEKTGGEYFSKKNYETLEIKPGNPYRDYKQNKPDSAGGRDFDWEITLINKNKETFDINIAELKATADNKADENNAASNEGYHTIEPGYTLLPNKNLYVRFLFPHKDSSLNKNDYPNRFDFTNCDSVNFQLNVTTRQTGGTDSWFGMAPNDDEEDWQEFVQGFDPKYEPDPGPLDIFAFTYPFGIDQEYYLDNSYKIQLIINMRNPKAEGVVVLDEFYFIQKFKFPTKYFEILNKECTEELRKREASEGNEGSKGIKVTVDRESPPGTICDDTTSNCLKFSFDPPLNISKGQVEEIKCEIDVLNVPLTDEYEDFMRISATYDFYQEYKQTLTCTQYY